MPTYLYKCSKCEREFDVFHTISEIDNPSDETLKEISCSGDKCDKKENFGNKFEKQVTTVNFGKFAAMAPNEKKKVLKKRADQNFKKDILERKNQMHKDMINGLKR